MRHTLKLILLWFFQTLDFWIVCALLVTAFYLGDFHGYTTAVRDIDAAFNAGEVSP